MSIMDAILEMCDDTSVGTTAGANALIGNYIDLGAKRDFYDTALTSDIGEAGDLWLTVRVSTSFAGTTGASTTIALYHHTAAGVASGAVFADTTTTKVLDTDTLTAGTTLIRQKLSAGEMNRYIGICADIDTQNLTAGSIDAWISLDSETPK